MYNNHENLRPRKFATIRYSYRKEISKLYIQIKFMYCLFHIIIYVDRNTRLCDINKAAGEKWQALNQEDREAYNKKAKEEISSPRSVELRKMLNELSKLVCQIY